MKKLEDKKIKKLNKMESVDIFGGTVPVAPVAAGVVGVIAGAIQIGVKINEAPDGGCNTGACGDTPSLNKTYNTSYGVK